MGTSWGLLALFSCVGRLRPVVGNLTACHWSAWKAPVVSIPRARMQSTARSPGITIFFWAVLPFSFGRNSPLQLQSRAAYRKVSLLLTRRLVTSCARSGLRAQPDRAKNTTMKRQHERGGPAFSPPGAL